MADSRSIFILLLLGSMGVDGGPGNKELSKNVSTTLDTLLASNRYDKRIRPGFGGPPVRISVNFLIKSLGPVSENDQSFGLDVYFRQHWYDLRLQYEKLPGLTEFSLSWLFLEKVWKPDTYFVNGKKSQLHRITAPNKFLRLRYDGFITYSMRLTISASCPMYLRKFPLDAQRCPLILGSYGYTSKDVIYDWESSDPISVEKGMELAQFDLVNVTIDEEKPHHRGGLDYSTIQTNYWLKRHTGYFMLQVYVPCCLIVLSSWVSFWIDPDDVMARVALGVTTVLSLTTMGFGGRAQLPKVSYWTALDWFIIICFTSVFSVMIEYACVNFIDKVIKDLKKSIEKKRKEQQEEAARQAKEATEETKEPKVRQRSASMSVAASASLGAPQEELIRRTSVGGDASTLPPPPVPPRKSSILDLGKKMRLPSLRQLPRKLSTTVREWIDVPALQDKLSRSMHNLSRLERGFRDPDMAVPRVVVSDEDEDGDITVDVEGDEDDMWQDDEGEEDIQSKLQGSSIFQRVKDLYLLWLEWKFLPQEVDVIRLMADNEPPDKFSNIDIGARKGFPLAFLTSLTVYLIAYAYYLTDDFPDRDTDLDLYQN